MIGVVVSIALTVVAVGLWTAAIGHRQQRRGLLRRTATVITVGAIDAWLLAIAFDPSVGPVPSLRAVVIIANAVLALGAVYSLFGVRPKSDVSPGGGPGAGTRYAPMVSPEESRRLSGLD
jgi:hypothetical protein